MNLLYRWKSQLIEDGGPAASALESRVRELELELRRTERERDILKKSVGHFRPNRVADMYAAVEQMAHEQSLPTYVVCEVLDLSRSAYYAWRNGTPTMREDNDRKLMPIIRKIFERHKRRYGARRIVQELKDLGYACGERRVSKLLKTQGLKAIQPKSSSREQQRVNTL